MDKNLKKILDELTKKTNESTDLSEEEKKSIVEALTTAEAALVEVQDYRNEDNSKYIEAKSSSDAQKQTIKKISDGFNKAIEKNGEEYKPFLSKEGDPSFKLKPETIEKQKALLDKYEFKVSKDFKEKVINIANKLDEYGINDPTKGGETGTKIYSFYKYTELKKEYKKAVKEKNIEKLLELKPKYEKTMSEYNELLDLTYELNKTDIVDNLDIGRENFYPKEFYYRRISASNLNGIFQSIAFCKKEGIKFEDFVENPFKYAKDSFKKIVDEKYKDIILPRTEPLSKRVAKIIDFQTSGEELTNYDAKLNAQHYIAGRALELFVKVDEGEGYDGRMIYGALSSSIKGTYDVQPFFAGVLDFNELTGLKNALLIGDEVDDLRELDPSYINPETFEKSKYQYKDSLEKLEITDNFMEEMIEKSLEIVAEAHRLQDQRVGASHTISSKDTLFVITSLFDDVLMNKDLSNHRELAKKLVQFNLNPAKYYEKFGDELGYSLDVDNDAIKDRDNDRKEAVQDYIKKNPMLRKAQDYKNLLADSLDSHTLTKWTADRSLDTLKKIDLINKYDNVKPSIFHPIDRYRWNKNHNELNALKNTIESKLKVFGITQEQINNFIDNPKDRIDFVKSLENTSIINTEKMKSIYDKAFEKGSLDDLTKEQYKAYTNESLDVTVDKEALIEANKIMEGNNINSTNLETSINLLKELNRCNTNDAKELENYIKTDLMNKGLLPNVLSDLMEDNIKLDDAVKNIEVVHIDDTESITVELDDSEELENDFELEGLEENEVQKNEDIIVK